MVQQHLIKEPASIQVVEGLEDSTLDQARVVSVASVPAVLALISTLKTCSVLLVGVQEEEEDQGNLLYKKRYW